MKPLYGFGRRGGVQGRVQGPELRLAFRPLQRHLPRALGYPEIPAGGRRGRQTHHSRRRRGEGRGQPRSGRRRYPLQHGARRSGEETEPDRRESAQSATIGPELRRRGLLFVGIDVIDGYLTEINVTSPTGIARSRRLAARIWRSRSGTRSRPNWLKADYFFKTRRLAGAGSKGNIAAMSVANAHGCRAEPARRPRPLPPAKGSTGQLLLDELVGAA